MDIRQHLAQQNIEDARQSIGRVHKKLVEEVDINRLAQERFYGTITLVAAGALVLSVTYLGYLKGAGGTPTDFYLLKTSWASLVLGVIASIFYHNFHTAYFHFARIREYASKKKAHREAALQEIDAITVLDDKGVKWTDSDLRLSLATEISGYGNDVTWNKKREDCYAHLYTWAGRAAQIAFVLGLILLLCFAIANA